MDRELLSPELALVDPELGARARAALPDRVPDRLAPRPPRPAPAAAAPAAEGHRPYPLWARATAALWLLVLGILIGGAAVPHAQDRPRLVPRNEEAPTTICPVPKNAVPPTPSAPGFGAPNRPGG
jgi:hypothetical protein